MIEFSDPIFYFFCDKFWGGPISRVPWGGPEILGGSHQGPMGGSHRGSHVKIPKVGGSNVPIPKVGGVRTPPTRAVAAPMLICKPFVHRGIYK